MQFGYLRLHFFNGVIGGHWWYRDPASAVFFSKQGLTNHIFLSRLPGPCVSHVTSAPGADDWRLHWRGVWGCGTTTRSGTHEKTGADPEMVQLCEPCCPAYVQEQGWKMLPSTCRRWRTRSGCSIKNHPGQQGDCHEDDGALSPATSAAAGTRHVAHIGRPMKSEIFSCFVSTNKGTLNWQHHANAMLDVPEEDVEAGRAYGHGYNVCGQRCCSMTLGTCPVDGQGHGHIHSRPGA